MAVPTPGRCGGTHDRVYKMDLYARGGVAFYWILDPAERILEAFELRDGDWTRIGSWAAGDIARVRPFEAVELEMDRLFPPP